MKTVNDIYRSFALKLHEVTGLIKGRTNWCGPSALSIITGKPYSTTLELLKEGRSPGYKGNGPLVKGTGSWEMRRALNKLGYRVMEMSLEPDQTFAAWTRERPASEVKHMVLLVVGNHWVVVQGRKACCGIVKKPTFIRSMRKRRGRVTEAYRITKLPAAHRPKAPKLKGLVRPIKRKPQDPALRAYREFRKLAAEHSFKYEIEREDTLAWIEIDKFPATGKRFTTMHYDWEETLRRVTLCIEDPSEFEEGGEGYSE
jgi:hypothetical protein